MIPPDAMLLLIAALLGCCAVAVAVLGRRGAGSSRAAPGSTDSQKPADEIRELMGQLDRLAGQIDRRIDDRQAQLADLLAQADQKLRQLQQALEAAPPARRPSIKLADTSVEIMRLRSEGLAPVEIARQMRMNVGEVELVLNLQKSRTV